MGDRRRSRRLAAVLVLAGLALGTAACGAGSGSAGGDPNTLEVWTRSNPDPAATYVRVFAAFTKKTGIEIDPSPEHVARLAKLIDHGLEAVRA